jgi:hypothetical protein
MIGNDVVDLRDADTRPETFRPRFDQRVFDPAERRAIERDSQPHARRWVHWAAKEAAYKLAKQVDENFVFSPSKLVAEFDSARPQAGDRVERRGVLTLPAPTEVGIRELELRSFETLDYVHVMALPAGADWEAVVWAVEPVEAETDTGQAVRTLARNCVARDLGISVERVAIGRRGRIPTVEIDGSPSTMVISISHHGLWVACAMTLRCDDVIPADEACGSTAKSRSDEPSPRAAMGVGR